MTSLNKKLLWSALAIAVLTTPALAQRQHRPASHATNAPLQSPALQYPNGDLKTGSAQNAEYGAEFNLGR
jgi:hypothetical protein